MSQGASFSLRQAVSPAGSSRHQEVVLLHALPPEAGAVVPVTEHRARYAGNAFVMRMGLFRKISMMMMMMMLHYLSVDKLEHFPFAIYVHIRWGKKTNGTCALIYALVCLVDTYQHIH